MIHLYGIPLIFALIGLAFYAVLAGADFGAGWWQLTAGRGPRSTSIRDHAHHAMAPVWEANHVWLIFVLTVVWTAYPTAFGAIASTLSIPLFIAAVGIVFRGVAYALRAGASTPRQLRRIDTVFAVSSILTPFALGTAVGGIASLRVPVGNAAGDPFSSWLNPTSILIGALAVSTAAYLAAVFLCADAARLGEQDLEERFRRRALGAGLVAGAMALGGLFVVRSDAHPLFHGLLDGNGLWGVAVSAAGGVVTLWSVWHRRFELARFTAALAVAAMVAGWALAQSPVLLQGLTIEHAAASHDVLVAVIVAVVAGGAILFPSLALLFRLVLRGHLDGHREGHLDQRPDSTGAPRPTPTILSASAPGLLARVALGCLLAGFLLLTVADAGWAHALGIVCLFGFVCFGFPAALPTEPFRTQR